MRLHRNTENNVTVDGSSWIVLRMARNVGCGPYDILVSNPGDEWTAIKGWVCIQECLKSRFWGGKFVGGGFNNGIT